jgi:hypothetical protein
MLKTHIWQIPMSDPQKNFKKIKQFMCAKYYIGLHRMYQTFPVYKSNTYKDAPFCLAAITLYHKLQAAKFHVLCC